MEQTWVLEKFHLLKSSNEPLKEDVSPSDSAANVDTSVSVESPVQTAPRRSLESRGSSRLALKALTGVLVKRRKQAEKRLQEKAVKALHKSKKVTKFKGLEECILALRVRVHNP